MASGETLTVGFIGLGQMGAPMVRNLIKAGIRPVVHNRSRAIVEAIAAEGADTAASAREVAERVDVLFTCVGFRPTSSGSIWAKVAPSRGTGQARSSATPARSARTATT